MVKIFFSYSHVNENMRNELEKHFSVMKRNGLIESWYDRRILPGEELDPDVMTNLDDLPPKKWTQRRVGGSMKADSRQEVSNGGKWEEKAV